MRISDWSSDVCSSDLNNLTESFGKRPSKEARDDPNTPLIESICERMRERPGKTLLVHVYRHTLDLNPEFSNEEVKRRTNKSEEPRVGKECVGTWRCRWSPDNSKKKT